MTQKQTKPKGFTIVELLIVVVIIAILAAITIVAYNGIQNRARTSAGASLANAIMKKAEAFNSVNAVYPTYCQFATNSLAPTGAAPTAGTTGSGTCAAGGAAVVGTESKLDTTTNLTPASANIGTGYTSAISSNNTVVAYFPCAAGANIFYYDFQPATPTIQTVKAGAGC